MRLRAQDRLQRAYWQGDCGAWRSPFSNTSWLLFLCQQLFNNAGHLAPALGFFIERLQPCLGDGVILRLAIVFRLAPGTTGPAVLFNPYKSRIDGALVEIQCVLRDLL